VPLTMRTLDPRWQNVMEESAKLLSLLVDYLSMACDSSSPAAKSTMNQIAKDQETEAKHKSCLVSYLMLSPTREHSAARDM
jgi:hypothetical protein